MSPRRAVAVACALLAGAVGLPASAATSGCVVARDAEGDVLQESWHATGSDPALDLRSAHLRDDGRELVVTLELAGGPSPSPEGRVWEMELSSQGVPTRLSLTATATGTRGHGQTGSSSLTSLRYDPHHSYAITAEWDPVAGRVRMHLPYDAASLRRGHPLRIAQVRTLSVVGVATADSASYVGTGQQDVAASGRSLVLGSTCR